MNSAERSERIFFGSGFGGCLFLSFSLMVAVPLSKKFQPIGSILPLLRSIDVQIKNEKINLSRSNRPLDMFVKIILVITSIRFAILSSNVSP